MIVTTIAETVVPRAGLEPALLAERDFESLHRMRLAMTMRAITSATILLFASGVTFYCGSAEALPHSRVQRAAFQKMHPCPANGKARGACPGYVVDHIWPLACGGEDHPRNMAWQTVAEGKAKDKWERKMCGSRSTP